MLSGLTLLQQRHSVPAPQLGAPAPDEATLRTLLEAAVRVPDHGKLVPFRLIRLQGEAKLQFGEKLVALSLAIYAGVPAANHAMKVVKQTLAEMKASEGK